MRKRILQGVYEDDGKGKCEELAAQKIPKGWHDYRKKRNKTPNPEGVKYPGNSENMPPLRG